jgi:hypothetical protein
VTPLAYSAGWWSGMRAGYRMAHRSLWRRLLVTICLSAVLLGASAGLLWASLDVFLANEAGPAIVKSVVGKFTAWNRIHKGGPR